jgi:3-carboxy-cis,cis-muconate cycloisomerase
MAIPESFVLTAGALHQAKFMLSGLIVDEKKMLENLNLTKGLIVAEAVMMGMAPFIGRQEAHDVVYDACREVNEKGGTLAEALQKIPEVTKNFTKEKIEELTNPINYLGMAPQMADKAVAHSRSLKF